MVRPLVAALVVAALVVGCTSGGSSTDDRPLIVVLRASPDVHHAAFVTELRTHRFVAGRDVVIRPIDDDEVQEDPQAAAAMLAELERRPDLVVAYSTSLAQVAMEELPDTPVVAVVNDLVASGLIASRDQPDGRVTGVTFASPPDRTLDLTARLVGGIDRIGYLAPSDDPAAVGHRDGVVRAADEVGIDVVDATFVDASEITAAVTTLAAAGVGVVLVATTTAVYAVDDEIERATADAGLVVVSNNARTEYADLVLEPDGASLRRQVARQVVRLLTGHPVEQIPVEDPRRFRLVLDDDVVARFDLDRTDPGLLRQAELVR